MLGIAKTTPPVGPRYWAAMCLASICGANTGDFVADELHLGHLSGLPALVVLFAIVAVADRATRTTVEAWYWLAVLLVRTAATNLADSAIAGAGLGYVTVAAGLTLLLAAILALRRTFTSPPAKAMQRTDASYWLAMLTAGTLGTIIADGVGHAIQPVTVGVPVSAVVATLALAVVLGVRAWAGAASAASYWVAIVAIRTWGTNVGDIAAFLLSHAISMSLSGAVLVALLVMWRKEPRPEPAFETAGGATF